MQSFLENISPENLKKAAEILKLTQELNTLRKEIKEKKILEEKEINQYKERIVKISNDLNAVSPDQENNMTHCSLKLILAELYVKQSPNDTLTALDEFIVAFKNIAKANMRAMLLSKESEYFANILITIANPELIKTYYEKMITSNSESDEKAFLSFQKYQTLASFCLKNNDAESAITYLALADHVDNDYRVRLQTAVEPYKTNDSVKTYLDFFKFIDGRKLVKAQDYIDLIEAASKKFQDNKELRLFAYKYALSVLIHIEIGEKEKKYLLNNILPKWKQSASLAVRIETLMKKLQSNVSDKKDEKNDLKIEAKLEGKGPSDVKDPVDVKSTPLQQEVKAKIQHEPQITPAPSAVEIKQTLPEIKLQTVPQSNSVSPVVATQPENAPKNETTIQDPVAKEDKIAQPSINTPVQSTIQVEIVAVSSKLKVFLNSLTEAKLSKEQKNAIRQYVDIIRTDADYLNKGRIGAIVSGADREMIEKIYVLLNKDSVLQSVIDRVANDLNIGTKQESDKESKEASPKMNAVLLLENKRSIEKLLKNPNTEKLQLLNAANKQKIAAIYHELLRNMFDLLWNVYEPGLDAWRSDILQITDKIRLDELFSMQNKIEACKLWKGFFDSILQDSKTNALSTQLAMHLLKNFQFCVSTNSQTNMLEDQDYLAIADAMLNICSCRDFVIEEKIKIKTFLMQLESVETQSSDALKKKVAQCFETLEKAHIYISRKQQEAQAKREQREARIKALKEQNQPLNDLLLAIEKLNFLVEADSSVFKRFKHSLGLGVSHDRYFKIEIRQLYYLNEILKNITYIQDIAKTEYLLLKNILVDLSLKNNPTLAIKVREILDFMEYGWLPSPLKTEPQIAEVKEIVSEQKKQAISPPKPVNNLSPAINYFIEKDRIYRSGEATPSDPHLVLIKIEEKELPLDPIQLRILSRQHRNAAILISVAQQFLLYGFNAKLGWQITKLDSEPFQHLKFASEPTLLGCYDGGSRLAMYNEIVTKQAHAFVVKQNISEEAWLDQAREVMLGDDTTSYSSINRIECAMSETESSLAAEMRNIIVSSESNIKVFKDSKENNAADELFCCSHDLGRLISACPATFEDYRKLFDIKIGNPGDVALEIFMNCVNMAKNFPKEFAKRDEYLSASLVGIGLCLTKLSPDLSKLDLYRKETLVATIKSLEKSNPEFYKKYRSLLKYFEVKQAMEMKTGQSSDRKDDLTPEQFFQNMLRAQSGDSKQVPDLKDPNNPMARMHQFFQASQQANSGENKADGSNENVLEMMQNMQQTMQQAQSSVIRTVKLGAVTLGLGFVGGSLVEGGIWNAGRNALYTTVGLFAADQVFDAVKNRFLGNGQQNKPNQRKP